MAPHKPQRRAGVSGRYLEVEMPERFLLHDLRTVSKCALSDEDTLQSLAVGLRTTEALVVGRLTAGFPLVVEINDLPEGFPATGVTRSYWDHPEDGGDDANAAKKAA